MTSKLKHQFENLSIELWALKTYIYNIKMPFLDFIAFSICKLTLAFVN